MYPSSRTICRLPAFAFGLLIALAAGCASQRQVRFTEKSTDCRESEIEILSSSMSFDGDETWTARCHNKIYRCSLIHSQEVFHRREGFVSCDLESTGRRPLSHAQRNQIAESLAKSTASSTPKSPAIKSDDTSAVKRVKSQDNHWMLKLDVQSNGFSIRFVGQPATHPDKFWFIVKHPKKSLHPQSDCELRLMVNGEVETLPLLERKPGELRVSLPIRRLANFTTANSIVGRVCDDEFRLTFDDRYQIELFRSRFSDELRWNNKPGLETAPETRTDLKDT